MKLRQRINYILLPVILAVFTLAGILAYQASYQYTVDETSRYIQRELIFAEKVMDAEMASVNSVLSELLNSAELIDYVNTPDPEYQAYLFEESLYKLLDRTKNRGHGIEVIQILGPRGKLLVSSHTGDPFSDIVMPLPDEIYQQLLPVINGEGDKLSIEAIYPAEQNAIKYALLQRFSPNMLLDDHFSTTKNSHYVALLISEQAFLSSLHVQLEEILNGDFELTFSSDPQTIATDTENLIQNESDANSLSFSLKHPLYQINLHVPESTLKHQVSDTRDKIIILIIVLTLLSFSILWILIRRQVIYPIDQLVEKVRDSYKHGNISLTPVNSNDEVAELNNAYLELLSDVDRLASFDSLTGLANRRTFEKVLIRQLQDSLEKNAQLALLYIDLDNFKRVNDNYGHAVGDRLLQLFGERVQDIIRPNDMISPVCSRTTARLAGDEFALLLSDVSDPDVIQRIAERILSIFSRGFEVDGVNHNVQASIGVTIAPEDGRNAQELLRHADAAMYLAKDSGKNRYQFFNKDIASTIDKRKQIESTLTWALENDEISLAFMPIYETGSLSVVGAEVLFRCPALSDQGIGPDQFIPVAESVGLIKKIDLWVIDKAFSLLKTIKDEQSFKGMLSINISAVELHNKEFIDQIQTLIDKHQIRPSMIEFEITETSLVSNDTESTEILERLKQLGLSISLDDFGTGYTAFNQLSSYPVDCLKIDKSFINEMDFQTRHKKPMVDIILALAELYQLRVIAEGVETREQLDYLKKAGCQQVQGFYLSKPIPWNEIKTMLKNHAPVETLNHSSGVTPP